MSVIIPELKLTYLEGLNPRHYSLNVKIDGPEALPLVIIGNDNGTMVTPNSEYLIVVEMDEISEGSVEIDVDMGEIPFDNDESEIKVQFKHNNSSVGEETVGVKEAQQESRPGGGSF